MQKRIPVIIFHNIGLTPPDKWTVSTEHFEAFLQYLQKNDFRTVPCSTALAHKDTYVPKMIVLTFDDGYASVYELAWPLLKKYGFTATVFMTTDFLDSVVTSGGQAAPALTSVQLQELAHNRIEIGSHGCRHTDLRKVTHSEKDTEFAESKKILERVTANPVTVFSYPHGRYDTSVEYAVKKAGYLGAFSVFTGLKNTSFTQYAYDRLELSSQAHPLRELEFRLKTSGVYLF